MRATLAANGVRGPLPIGLALDVAGILVQTGRTVEPGKWVDAFAARAEAERLEGLV